MGQRRGCRMEETEERDPSPKPVYKWKIRLRRACGFIVVIRGGGW